MNWRFSLDIYRVMLKKVSFCTFRSILLSREEKRFTIESKDKDLAEGVKHFVTSIRSIIEFDLLFRTENSRFKRMVGLR